MLISFYASKGFSIENFADSQKYEAFSTSIENASKFEIIFNFSKFNINRFAGDTYSFKVQ